MTNILVTKDYDKFKFLEKNRPINHVNLRKLTASMKQENLMEIDPIIVDKDLYVIDGQHRVLAAKKLKLPVHYIITDKDPEQCLTLLNINKEKWCTSDFVHYYTTKGNETYKFLTGMSQKTGLKAGSLMRILELDPARMREGNLNISQETQDYLETHLMKSVEISKTFYENTCIQGGQKKWIFSSRSLRALFNLSKSGVIDMDYLLQKMLESYNQMHIQGNMGRYLQQFLDVYNLRRRNRVEIDEIIWTRKDKDKGDSE